MNEPAPPIDGHYLIIIEKLADVTATLRSLEASVREKREDISQAHMRITKLESKLQANIESSDRALVERIDKAKETLDARIRLVEMRVFAGVVLCLAVVGVIVPVTLHMLAREDSSDANPYPQFPQNPLKRP